jgi:hypothetical protein
MANKIKKTSIEKMINKCDKFLKEMPVAYNEYCEGFKEAIIQTKAQAIKFQKQNK